MKFNPSYKDAYKIINFIFKKLKNKSRIDARLILSKAVGKKIYGHEKIYFSHKLSLKLEELINLRISGITISRLFGRKEFWSNNFYLNQETLDPRPETELIVDEVLNYLRLDLNNKFNKKILDIGTGSGCILLSLLSEDKSLSGVGTDISALAISQARANASFLNLSKRVNFINTNWTMGVTGKFDIIVSNPPYVKKSENLPLDVLKNDPHLAIFSGDDGLNAYREIFSKIKIFMDKSTRLFIEIGKNQENSVKSIAQKNKFKYLSSKFDLKGIERCLIFTNN